MDEREPEIWEAFSETRCTVHGAALGEEIGRWCEGRGDRGPKGELGLDRVGDAGSGDVAGGTGDRPTGGAGVGRLARISDRIGLAGVISVVGVRFFFIGGAL